MARGLSIVVFADERILIGLIKQWRDLRGTMRTYSKASRNLEKIITQAQGNIRAWIAKSVPRWGWVGQTGEKTGRGRFPNREYSRPVMDRQGMLDVVKL